MKWWENGRNFRLTVKLYFSCGQVENSSHYIARKNTKVNYSRILVGRGSAKGSKTEQDDSYSSSHAPFQLVWEKWESQALLQQAVAETGTG